MTIYVAAETIAKDTLLATKEYHKFVDYKFFTEKLKKVISGKLNLQFTDDELSTYLSLNPEFYYPYYLVAEYFLINGESSKAKSYYESAVNKEIPTIKEVEEIKEKIKTIEQK